MPVSKKRKKKSYSGPPLSKKEIAAKKKKITTQRILIYIFSALIILSMTISFIIGSSNPTPPTGADNNGQVTTPLEGDESNILAPESQDAETQDGASETGAEN